MLRKVLAIIRKDALMRFAQPSEWLFFLLLPIVFTFLLAGGTGGNERDTRPVLPVVDEAQNALSRQILDGLESSSFLRPELVKLSEAEERFRARRAAFWLRIPAGLSPESLQIEPMAVELHLQPNNLAGLAAERAIQSVLRSVGARIQAARVAVDAAETRSSFNSSEARRQYFIEAMELASELQASTPQRLIVNRAQTADEILYDPRANSSAGQLITWVFIPLFGISALMAYERSSGTLSRLLTTPTSQATFLLGTIGGQVVMALVQMALLIGFGSLVLGVDWARDLPALSVILLTAALAAASIGTAMGTIVRSESQANNLSIMLGMVMALLGGCWYPLELFPPMAQNIVRVLPTTWAMQGMIDLTLRGQGLVEILPEAGVLMGFAALFFSIGIARFRHQIN